MYRYLTENIDKFIAYFDKNINVYTGETRPIVLGLFTRKDLGALGRLSEKKRDFNTVMHELSTFYATCKEQNKSLSIPILFQLAFRYYDLNKQRFTQTIFGNLFGILIEHEVLQILNKKTTYKDIADVLLVKQGIVILDAFLLGTEQEEELKKQKSLFLKRVGAPAED